MAEATTIVIFGASGDLTRRKLVPALYNKFKQGRLPDKLNIVGVSRTEYSHDEYRNRMRDNVADFAKASFDDDIWGQFAPKLYYVPADAGEQDGMQKLSDSLGEIEDGTANRLYYLSVAPGLYTGIVGNLGAVGIARDTADSWRRLVVEKPFGYDLASALELSDTIHAVFDERQVYRIDHYLGKETAQNILYYRFANTINEPIWNRNYIDNVQITVAESVDVGRRAGYYDGSGVLRDMFQNHLLQLLTLVAMEPPSSLEADALRNEKVKVLQSVRPIVMTDTVRAQYDGYCELEGVADGSQTPTYAALKLFIDNWRWQGVPFYLRSGKALTDKVSEIVVTFKQPPLQMFDMQNGHCAENRVSLCIQPDEGIHQSIEAKVPDEGKTRTVELEFHYRDSFDGRVIPDAYERLLLDALNGDASLFTRHDEIEAAWTIIDGVMNGWTNADDAPTLTGYTPGTWGPDDADQLLANDGRSWQVGCRHD